AGWALNDNGAVGLLAVSVDGVPDGMAADFLYRPEVCAVYPGRANCPFPGWNYALNTLKFADGRHTLDVTVGSGSQHATFSTSFRIDNSSAAAPTLLYVDQPSASSGTLRGIATVSGWAVDDRSSLNNGVL